jgi:hypothetical protein
MLPSINQFIMRHASSKARKFDQMLNEPTDDGSYLHPMLDQQIFIRFPLIFPLACQI